MQRLLHISEPCSQSWNGMQGGSARRFCASCQKEVHAISEMTEEQAAELIRSAPRGTLCIRAEHDDQGRVFFREAEQSSKRSLPLFKIAMTASLLAACHGEPKDNDAHLAAQPEIQAPQPAPSASEKAEISEKQEPMPVDSCAPKRLAPGSLPQRPPAASADLPQPSKGDRRVTMGCICAPGDTMCSCL